MKEFVALLVLSMPILAVLCIAGLASYAGWAAARRMNEPKKKWMAWVVAALAVILVFAWDEIVGRPYFYYLCATEGGPKVYRQVTLSSEYWRTDGSPLFLDKNGAKISSRLDDVYAFERTGEQQVSSILRIKKYSELVSDRNTGELLGTDTTFHYFGGWFVNHFSPDVSGTHCPIGHDDYSRFLKTLFVSTIESTGRVIR